MEKCKHCGTKLVKRETRKSPSQLKKAYYYTAYYYCPNCGRLYHDDKFKVMNENAAQSMLLAENDLTLPSSKRRGSNKVVFDVEIWTDGACTHNGHINAKAAWAFVSGDTERSGIVTGDKQTNNVAEGLAILNALQWAGEKGFKKIKIYTDSQITIHNLMKPSNLIKQNREIFQGIENLIQKFTLEVIYEKVIGHSGDINNERADMLANKAASQ